MSSRSGAVARLLFVDLLGSIAWFPIWWYTKGLKKVVDSAIGALRYRIDSFSFKIWIKNFFVPMYGQYDVTGRLVSVLMRSIVLGGRSIFLAVESVVYVVGIAVWILAPIACLGLGIVSFIHGATLSHASPIL